VANDKLPKGLLTPHDHGGAAGIQPDLEKMLPEYYAAQGWDPRTGRPTSATLEQLGLADVAQDLWKEVVP
jgi:aldehyde:ferredoxin oxidoreductase